MIPVARRYRYKIDRNNTWHYSMISQYPDLQKFDYLDVEFLYCGHDVQMLQADLANTTAENACLKYENDQLKKELMLATKTMEYMQDERTALLKIIGDKDV